MNTAKPSNGKKMVLEPFTLLRSGPIHKEAVRQMHRRNGDEHVDNNSERCKAAQEGGVVSSAQYLVSPV